MFYIEIKSHHFLRTWGRFLTGEPAQAAAIYPFIFISNQMNSKMKKYFINHELIHFRQQIETLFVGFIILNFIEQVYLRIFNSKFDAYLKLSSEKEAYENMFNLSYLDNRPIFANYRNYLNKSKLNWEEFLNKKGEAQNE